MPDKDGYPTNAELKTIKDWDFLTNFTGGVKDFLPFLKDIWWMSDWGYILKGKNVLRLELHTGGWSGNEEIIGVLRRTMFWTLYWEKSVRGGHYYFMVKPIKKT